MAATAGYDQVFVEHSLAGGHWTLLPETTNPCPLIKSALHEVYRAAGGMPPFPGSARYECYFLYHHTHAMLTFDANFPNRTQSKIRSAARRPQNCRAGSNPWFEDKPAALVTSRKSSTAAVGCESIMAADDKKKPPQDAFALIGNEIRAAILRTLAGPEDEGPWKELAFNELQSRVDPGMDSSQFNYHLQKLVGLYVRSTEQGYQISPAGVKLYRAIVAGTFTRDETIEPFDAGFDCHFCGARVEGSYQDDQFQVRCPECGHFYASNIVPPSLIDEGDDVLNRVDRIVRNEMRIAANRVCPNCVNSLDADIIPATESAFESADDIEVLARVKCDHCGATRFMTIGTKLLSESSLHAFAHDHGMDLNETPVWELEFASTDRNLTIRSRDPWELVFSLTLDEETIEYVIDGELEVIRQTLTKH